MLILYSRPFFQFIMEANFCKDHCDKTETLDPLAVEDLISYKKLNNRRNLERLIT